MKKRVSAVIIDGDKILLIRRVKPEAEYYTLPGGTVEEGEGLESAMIREAKEELSVDVKIGKILFEIKSDERIDYYFLIESFSGTPELGGPEKERVTKNNQYHLEWVRKKDFENLGAFYPNPSSAKEKLVAIWK